MEVKARAKRDDAREAIDGAKRRRFSRAVRAWIGRNAWCAGATFRADAVFVFVPIVTARGLATEQSLRQ